MLELVHPVLVVWFAVVTGQSRRVEVGRYAQVASALRRRGYLSILWLSDFNYPK